MTKFTPDTTLREVRKLPEFADFAPFIMFNNQAPGEDPINPGLDPEDFTMKSPAVIEGLETLRGYVRDGVKVSHDFWTDEEKREVPGRKNTKLIFMPGKPGAPFVMVIAGGAYATVCSFLEGFPTAMRLNQMGINAFVLSYRVNETPLYPKPQEDLAAALRYIFAHADEFRVDTKNYAVCGFSAGGSLTGSWGTKGLGYERFGLPRPGALMVCYGASRVEAPKAGEPRNRFLDMMIGPNASLEQVKLVNNNENITPDYPPTFLWHCKDDPLVPFANAIEMDEKLTENGVPHVFKAVEKGGHGLGIADGTPAAGWLEEAVAFWQSVCKK